ncbi:MAG: tRNA pseudouridine(38-40) synthase TruA [Clostridia bacterium]|nr:tRNA pseudouridine(38-40) synthase TruA [Clostridia bacterium]
MPRFLMTICYDGTKYHGWQVQENAVTVQPTVQDALQQIIGVRPDICGCSRTDSGVHALEYCFHFDYDGNIPCKNLVNALNTKLPTDIAAVDCVQVAEDFHARYSVASKEYVYKILNSPQRNPFYEDYAWFVKTPLDAQLMDKAAKKFVGTYDFIGFCSSGSSVQDTVRNVKSASVHREGDTVIFKVEADGFLYNMVRIMVGTLMDVAYGKTSVDDIEKIILSKDRNQAGITAPAKGLYLNKVIY